MPDYHDYKRDTLAAIEPIGTAIGASWAERLMSPDQVERRRARNFMTDDVWRYRRVGDGNLIVEISYGWVMGRPVFGLTVFCVGALSADAETQDHALSRCVFSPEDIAERLRELDAWGLARLSERTI